MEITIFKEENLIKNKREQTWRDEICAGSVNRCPATFAVPWDGDLVPSAVVNSPRCGLHLNAARSQIQVEVDVTVDQFHGKVITL